MKAQKLNGLQAQLKPCPMCGTTPRLREEFGSSGLYRVRCANYGCGMTINSSSDVPALVAKWNHREGEQ